MRSRRPLAVLVTLLALLASLLAGVAGASVASGAAPVFSDADGVAPITGVVRAALGVLGFLLASGTAAAVCCGAWLLGWWAHRRRHEGQDAEPEPEGSMPLAELLEQAAQEDDPEGAPRPGAADRQAAGTW